MSFKDIKGQDSAVSFLRNSISGGRLAHSYIFAGPEGIGKRLAAMNFAKALNCLSEDSDKPCDSCPSCKKIDSLNHPDIFYIKPEKPGGSIGIDAIRGAIKDSGLKPYEGRKKVYIIDEADTMKHEAANSILKTLEEPQPGCIFILIAQGLDRILPTIVSRSQVVRFFSLGVNDIKNILVKSCGIDDARAQVASYLSCGRPGKAVKYGEADFLQKREAIIKGLIDRTFFDSDFDALSKQEIKAYLDIMLSWYRDILIVKAGASQQGLLANVDKKESILSESRRSGFDYLDKMIKTIILTGSFLEQNANPKVAMGALGLAVMDYR